METNAKGWVVSNDHALRAQFPKYQEKYPREYESLFRNLHKIIILLMQGNKIGAFHVAFFRSEGDGVYRIGQTGVKHAKESRLYVYPDSENCIMHILSVGHKDEQQENINNSKSIVREIRALKQEQK